MTIFRRGVPTEVDVAKLEEAYGVPGIGTMIEHDAISEVIGVPKDSSRYETVCRAWRAKIYREHNVFMASVRGHGFRAAQSRERVGVAAEWYSCGLRKIRRVADLISTTDRAGLSKEQSRAADHLAHVSATITAAHLTAAKQMPSIDWKRKK